MKEQKLDEESFPDERAGKSPSDFVEEKLHALLKYQSLPVSLLRNKQIVRPYKLDEVTRRRRF